MIEIFPLLKLYASGCTQSSLFGIGVWYKYIPQKTITTRTGNYCELDFNAIGLGSAWLVVAGIIDILLRISAFVAVGFFIWGAFKMVTSQGSPEGVKSARNTMTNALVGLVICILSTWLVSFLVERILA